MFGFRFEAEPDGSQTQPGFVEHLGDRGVRAGSDDAVDLGNQRAQLFAVALRQTTGYDQLLAGAFHARVCQDRLGRFRLRRIDEGAGIDHDRIRVSRIGNQIPTGQAELADHDLGVDQVFGAAQTYEGDARCRFLQFAPVYR